MSPQEQSAAAIREGRTAIGIELGSTRIKACLIDEDHQVLATGGSEWENSYLDKVWTYSLDEVWSGVQAACAALLGDAEERHGVRPTTAGALGVSAMMHGYLAFDAAGDQLVPFRTWRNTSTGAAAEQLTELFGQNIPLRWSIAHLYQAVLDGEAHVPQVDFLTTLAGYVHWRLTGEKVLGVGDASGMFPIQDGAYHADMLADFDTLAAQAATRPTRPLAELLPRVLDAGAEAGSLTAEGAAALDPTGTLQPGIPLCPPEGDAGTGMVATNSVAPRTGNVSAGTSIFAMVVLEGPLKRVHHEIDLVTTPAGDPVAMVHCNNGASELGAWAELLGQFAAALGSPAEPGEVYAALLGAALEGDADGGGLLAYNYLAGEPITGVNEGRPMVVRTPGSRLSLANFARTQVYGIFGTLSLGMRVLDAEGVRLEAMFAHGGLFRTAGVAQRLLAAALGAPVAVGDTAAEGGAWGMAVLAAYRRHGEGSSLSEYLSERVFAEAALQVVEPDAEDVAGYSTWLETYAAGVDIQRTAVETLR
ncbi:xylulokinase [Bogoriella caseilytica]|uniref:Sugar (Pentulose or hexulose) kinase n=1 Tax=Bogoriella caseilytica TaxID=56055 RepID=A0A3N2BAF8_9MICO|nr:FGGY-family carbohydrate kinase [Bogoriella caseilytica]ROR72249.1 sugar (pentulose or hexulose) kinase [Bogoriella caseilytica]